MTPDEKQQFEEMKRELALLRRYVTVRADVVQINGPLSVKGPIELMGVQIRTGSGVPATGIAPQGSFYLRDDGASTTTAYVCYNTALQWADLT